MTTSNYKKDDFKDNLLGRFAFWISQSLLRRWLFLIPFTCIIGCCLFYVKYFIIIERFLPWFSTLETIFFIPFISCGFISTAPVFIGMVSPKHWAVFLFSRIAILETVISLYCLQL